MTMEKPRIEGALGLAWRPRKNGWCAIWLARQDIVAKKGYKPSTRQIGVFTSAPTEQESFYIRSQCLQFQEDMIKWSTDVPKPSFDGTVAGLVRSFRLDPVSQFHKLRHASKKHYTYFIDLIDRDHGKEKLADLGARDFVLWHEKWTAGTKVSLAHAAMTMIRIILRHGSKFEIEKSAGLKTTECLRLRMILHDMQFPNAPPRTETLTRAHCEAIRAAAHKMGRPSIALAQALQFNLCLRQKDVIGEWIPIEELGLSEITHRGQKWLRGIRWEEIDSNMILKHQMSKSRKAKMLEFDLKLYPMVMEELARIPDERRVGPLIISEIAGRPWQGTSYRQQWRNAADAAGIPKSVRNMDSRAGGTTETIDVTDGNLEAARKQAGHSDISTTQRYSRGALQSNSKVAVLRTGAAVKNEA